MCKKYNMICGLSIELHRIWRNHENVTWHKVPGLNGVSPNVIKSLDDCNKKNVMQIHEEMDGEWWYTLFWLEQVKISPITKKGNLNYQKKRRGYNLLDAGSKMLSIILNIRAQKILKINGHLMQLGAAPGAGFSDFCLFKNNTAIKEREQCIFTCFICRLNQGMW